MKKKKKISPLLSSYFSKLAKLSHIKKPRSSEHYRNLARLAHIKRKIDKKTHGMSGTRIYKIWNGMKRRVERSEKHKDNKYYFERGIKVSKRWKKFVNFYRDMELSYNKHLIEHGEKNTTLDRINNNKGYNKINCRWATPKVQALNRRNNLKKNV